VVPAVQYNSENNRRIHGNRLRPTDGKKHNYCYARDPDTRTSPVLVGVEGISNVVNVGKPYHTDGSILLPSRPRKRSDPVETSQFWSTWESLVMVRYCFRLEGGSARTRPAFPLPPLSDSHRATNGEFYNEITERESDRCEEYAARLPKATGVRSSTMEAGRFSDEGGHNPVAKTRWSGYRVRRLCVGPVLVAVQ